ncbi:high mobility group box domain-containing protein, partial [Dissophora ornata]
MTSVYFPPSASALHQKRRKAKKHALRVPRPKNCFMLYRSKILPMVMVELGMINNKIISKIAAERWHNEPEPVKAWYRLMAKRIKDEHVRNNPGYKYAPHK